ncbi:hypothetical protein IPC1180_25720 [Pseudomonas aeruginosa]|nr:hypothetical protein HW09_00655 [Pseudomonas aeruginosa]ERZ25613.1 hypothetical protein Q007_00283 [Pseudomonas aeruginosa S54485]PAO91098.1 hypothetical protein BV581_18065 [Stutzerimonas stutzeri]PBY75521.1 hypothetical protein CJT47_21735 [Pseudomonas aeruginosa]PPB02752.1 hypothetical protein HV84_13965 [Pseudomonas aeruginosa]
MRLQILEQNIQALFFWIIIQAARPESLIEFGNHCGAEIFIQYQAPMNTISKGPVLMFHLIHEITARTHQVMLPKKLIYCCYIRQCRRFIHN